MLAAGVNKRHWSRHAWQVIESANFPGLKIFQGQTPFWTSESVRRTMFRSNALARAHDHKKRQAFVYEALCEPLIPVLAKVASEYDDSEDTFYSTGGAFAAKLTNGHVVTGGRADDGGDSSAVQAELTAVNIHPSGVKCAQASDSKVQPELKKEPCRNLRKYGSCFGDECRFAHSIPTLATPKPCRHFRQSGHCRFGDECKFSHVTAKKNND